MSESKQDYHTDGMNTVTLVYRVATWPVSVPEKIEWLLEHRGWTCRGLAARFGVHVNTITNWRRGRHDTQYRTVIGLALDHIRDESPVRRSAQEHEERGEERDDDGE